MIISTSSTSVIPSSIEATAFTMSSDASMFAAVIKNQYSDPIKATIRELSTNCIDSSIEADMPIKWSAHIPTLDEPTFSVRDYGPGMTIDFLTKEFTVVGHSSKRNSNKTNGTFGFGRLSPLAYTSSFTVESWNNGMYYSFLVSTQDGKPAMIPLASEPSTEPTGCRFSVAVEPTDIEQFRRTAANLYKYFDHKPTINIDLPSVNIHMNTDFCILTDDSSGVVMANVYYPLDTSIVPTSFRGIVLKVPTGSVALTPGRESLNYDASTVTYLKSFLEECESELITIMNTTIASQPTSWTQWQSYHNMLQATPYKLRKNLTYPGSSLLRCENATVFDLPTCDQLIVTPSYAKANNTSRFYHASISFLYNSSPILLVDSRNFTHVYENYDYLYILKPQKADIDNIKDILSLN